jgi:hypothetical protein
MIYLAREAVDFSVNWTAAAVEKYLGYPDTRHATCLDSMFEHQRITRPGRDVVPSAVAAKLAGAWNCN